jgi:cytochrome c5
MSEIHLEEHHSPIKTPKQLIAAVVLAFVVPIAIIVLLTQFLTIGIKLDPESNLMAPEYVAERIKPVGQLVIAEAGGEVQAAKSGEDVAAAPAPASAPATATPASAKPTATAGSAVADGKAVYEKNCAACHMTGAANAPKAGDKAAWEPRLKEGIDHLYEQAIQGKGAMPPKGGNATLSDAEVKSAVDYLTSLVK